MNKVLLIGVNHELLESVVQTLEAADLSVHLAESVAGARQITASGAPLAIVVEKAIAAAEPTIVELPLLHGGAFILFRTADDVPVQLRPTLLRAAMAELTLPLEKHRLTTLIERLRDRHRVRQGDLGGSTESHPG